MCGIFGFVALHGAPVVDAERFHKALLLMRNRGPNAQKSMQPAPGVLLGHVRLSIIDLSEANDQPFGILGRYFIVYNGEVFNYVELREELRALGAVFRTDGDTEVVVWAYHFWGEDCVRRFNGMWAMAIYDVTRRSLFLSRDRFGEKPLYYAWVSGALLFSSEVKSMLALVPALAEPDLASIVNFCRTSVGAQHEQTWFRNIVRLPPGCSLRMDESGWALGRYWDYPEGESVRLSLQETVEQYRELFCDGVRLRLRSDMPLGLTLSSGIDSSSIACVTQAADRGVHHAFTAGFDPGEYRQSELAAYAANSAPIDEAAVATRLSREIGLEHTVVPINFDGLVSQLRRIVWHLEAGNSSPAVVPLMQVMAAATQKVSVVLEGQGADELLGGYASAVLWPAIADELRHGHALGALSHINGFRQANSLVYAAKIGLRTLGNEVPAINAAYQRLSGLRAVLHPSLWSTPPMRDWPAAGEMRNVGRSRSLGVTLRRQHTGGLVNLLHYGDALSMAHGVESRLPFLDHRLVEFTWRLPGDFKVRAGIGKWIHRQAMQGLIPAYILDGKRKLGFDTPIAARFTGPGSTDEDPVSVLMSPELRGRGVFDATALHTMIRRHQTKTAELGNLLFRVTLVELWFREFIDRDWSTAV
jgi:asparagine synthase (glutamine-hydrolysing)